MVEHCNYTYSRNGSGLDRCDLIEGNDIRDEVIKAVYLALFPAFLCIDCLALLSE